MVLTKNIFLNQYWDYYLTLEHDFIELEKIIPVDPINKNTFSLKYLKLLFSICSEIDVLFKELLSLNGYPGNAKEWDIPDYMTFIKENCNQFNNEIVIYDNEKRCSPFEEWSLNKNLTWWTKYNLGKHHRTDKTRGVENYKRINQDTVLLSLSGLYQLELYFFAYITKDSVNERDLRVPAPPSKIFILENWKHNRKFISDNTYI